LETLNTLPDREFFAGLAEVIKCGIIADAKLFAQLERDLPKILKREPETLSRIITRCCEIKAQVVGKDETDNGLRSILNFGHTIGHAIENSSGYGKLLHGEAISIGQVAAAKISEKILGLPGRDVQLSGGEIKFVLAGKIGKVIWNQRVPEHLIQQTMDEIPNHKLK
jgi:3-dehydroquinate synthase